MPGFQTSFLPQYHQKKPDLPRPILRTNPSHKRRRDEVEDEDYSPTFVDLTPSVSIEVEPVYGEGMTLIDPATGRAIPAESQTGTWYEENLELERQASIKAAESLAQAAIEAAPRPAKSLRLEKLPESPFSTSCDTPRHESPGRTGTETPSFDPASHLLGVGWTVVGKDSDIQAAAKGWAKYIDNHYRSLSNSEILLRSEAHQAYLVKATHTPERKEGYFLFADDLNEGKLVADDWDTCINNLRTALPIFEGQETLRAVRTPSPLDSSAMADLGNTGNNVMDSSAMADLDNIGNNAMPTDAHFKEMVAVEGGMDID
jgi:hypothetical protein